MQRLKPLLTTLAVTGALVGGGAAIANAATSTSSTPATTATSTTPATTSAATTPTTPPAQHNQAPGGRPGTGSHHCPGMSSTGTSSSGA